MNWMVTFERLGTIQRTVLNRLSAQDKSAWIKGFAGSGKTVLLIHFIMEQKKLNPGKTICCVVYTHALKDLVQTGLEIGSNIPVMTYFQFLKEKKRYDLVIVDEVQDVPQSDLMDIKKYSSRLILGGDTDQSIYEKGASAEQINEVVHPEIHELNIIYRLTDKLRRIVQTILPNSHIENAAIHKGANIDITLAKATTYENEVNWVCSTARRYSAAGDPAAILLQTHKTIQKFIRHIGTMQRLQIPEIKKHKKDDYKNKNRDEFYDAVNNIMRVKGLPYRYLGNDIGALTDSDNQEIVYIMTYHSVKGLDFETVFLPEMNASRRAFNTDEALDRRLFFVACTRSRSNLFFSYHENLHKYISQMPQENLNRIECAKALNVDRAKQENQADLF